MELRKLNERVDKLVNFNLNVELNSSYKYLALAGWCYNNGYLKAFKKYMQYSKEEKEHAEKVQMYLLDKNCTPIITGTEDFTTMIKEVKGILDVLEKSYEHECYVTDKYRKLIEVCKEVKDEQTYTLAFEILKEQIEEESKFADLLSQAKILGLTNNNYGMCHIQIDKLIEEI